MDGLVIQVRTRLDAHIILLRGFIYYESRPHSHGFQHRLSAHRIVKRVKTFYRMAQSSPVSHLRESIRATKKDGFVIV